MRRRLLIGALTVSVIATVVGGAIAVQGQSGEQKASEELKKLEDKGSDDAVVAIVDGQPITRRAVDASRALGFAGAASIGSGSSLEGQSSDEILALLIDQRVVAHAAEKAGVTASDDEVTMAINAGIVEPLADTAIPAETKRALQESLRAMGVSPESATKSPEVRDAYRRFLLVHRYVLQTGRPFDSLASEARSTAQIQVFPDVLHAAR
jgi:hypothetical protein